MPKRDAAYMEGQRDLIAQAALDCMVERGLYDTSIRDICMQAGVSIGAFYTHFPDRQAVVLAACALDYARRLESGSAETWTEYAEGFRALRETLDDPWHRKRLRLSYQIV